MLPGLLDNQCPSKSLPWEKSRWLSISSDIVASAPRLGWREVFGGYHAPSPTTTWAPSSSWRGGGCRGPQRDKLSEVRWHWKRYWEITNVWDLDSLCINETQQHAEWPRNRGWLNTENMHMIHHFHNPSQIKRKNIISIVARVFWQHSTPTSD